MDIPERLKSLAKPGEKAIVCNPEEGVIHFTDFPPQKKTQRPSLTDIVDTDKDTNVLQVTSMAMRLPGKMSESPDCHFRGAPIQLRVIYYDSPEPLLFLFISPRS